MAAPFDELLIIEETRVLESWIDPRDPQIFDTHNVFGRLDVTINLGGALHQVGSYHPWRLRGFILCGLF
jgi:hypothetical protein